jgi:hypothetical protein
LALSVPLRGSRHESPVAQFLVVRQQGHTMDKSFINADFIGRCIDNAIWLGIGIVGLIYYPWKIRRDIKADILTEAKGKSRLSQVRILCYFAIAVGVFRILRVLP